MPKDRGAEQGNVDGPLECSLALGLVAAETRGPVAAQVATGNLAWIGVDDSSEMQRLQAANTEPRCRESPIFSWVGPRNSIGADDRRHALQEHGGLAGLWYIDDGDIFCHPITPATKLEQRETYVADLTQSRLNGKLAR